jgi:hypothetical protein
MKFLLIAVALTLPAVALCFEVEKSDGSSIAHDGDITTITAQGYRYQVWAVPSDAKQLEIFDAVPEKYRGDFLRKPSGELMGSDEVAKVLEIYYRESAFDFDSMKIRNLAIPGLRYVSVCDSFVVQCLTRTVRAGTFITYEVNSKNRLGGMTGFEGQQLLITMLPATEETATTVPGRIPRATAEQLKGVLSDGYSAAVDVPVDQVLRTAQTVLTKEGFTFAATGPAGSELYSDPLVLKLTSKQAGCGKLYGLAYVGDSRTETTVLAAVSAADGKLVVHLAVAGILRVDTPKIFGAGGGPADKALTCTSTGALERELADKIISALRQ